jgi:hypothetical protein
VILWPLDVTNYLAAEAAVNAAVERFGRLDVVANVAGYIDKGLQLDRQDFAIPAGQFGEAIVSQNVRPFLGIREVRDPQAGNRSDAEQLGGLHPAVTSDDLAGIVNERRVDEAEPLDVVSDFPDLLPGMRPGIALVSGQAVDLNDLNPLCRSRGSGSVVRRSRGSVLRRLA